MVRLLAIAALLLAGGCYLAPQRSAPAVGTYREFRFCYGTSQGAFVYRDRTSACPDSASVEAIIRKSEEIYGVALAGMRIFVQQGWVECQEHGHRVGCASGDDVTVTGGVTFLGTLQHEVNHVGHYRSGAQGPWMDPDLRGEFFQKVTGNKRDR